MGLVELYTDFIKFYTKWNTIYEETGEYDEFYADRMLEVSGKIVVEAERIRRLTGDGFKYFSKEIVNEMDRHMGRVIKVEKMVKK